MNKSKQVILLFILMLFFSYGCSTEYGQRVISSHYVFPNSNVVPLGYTSAEISMRGFFIPKQITKETYEGLFNKALSRHEDADIIIDMGLDVTYTQIPIPIFSIWITKMNINGTAASVEVGEIELTKVKRDNIHEMISNFHNLDKTK